MDSAKFDVFSSDKVNNKVIGRQFSYDISRSITYAINNMISINNVRFNYDFFLSFSFAGNVIQFSHSSHVTVYYINIMLLLV